MRELTISQGLSYVLRACSRIMPRSAPPGGQILVLKEERHNPSVRVMTRILKGDHWHESDFLSCDLSYVGGKIVFKVRLNATLCGTMDQLGPRPALVAQLIRMAPRVEALVSELSLRLDPEA